MVTDRPPSSPRVGFGHRPRTRSPAWACAWTFTGGSVAVAAHDVMSSVEGSTAVGRLGVVAGTMLMALAVLLWLQPRHRHGIGMTILGMAVVVLTGRGTGYLIAALLAGIGGCLAVRPSGGPSSTPPGRRRRRASFLPATVRRGELVPIPVPVDSEPARWRPR